MKKQICIEQTGYGHYRISMKIYNKVFSTITTNSVSVDEYRDFDNSRRSNSGYKALYSKLMNEYRAKNKKVTF
jgi:hypothetical protein